MLSWPSLLALLLGLLWFVGRLPALGSPAEALLAALLAVATVAVGVAGIARLRPAATGTPFLTESDA
jgi:hypothetical protein